MISRSTAIALAFACLATLSVAMAAQVQQSSPATAAHATGTMAVIDMPRVVVTGHVVPGAAP